jgi:hypothetical protein
MSKNRTHGTKLGGYLAAGSTGLLASVTLLLVLAPAGMGMAVHSLGTKTIVAPYKGATSLSNSWSVNGCGKAKVVSMAMFNLKTGSGGFSDSASGKTCGKTFGGVGGYGSGYAGGTISMAIKLPGKTAGISGATSVVATWALMDSGVTSLSPGKCSFSAGASFQLCETYADAYVYAYPYIVDQTNNTYSYPSTYWSGMYNDSYNETYCYSGTCYNYSYGASGSFSNSVTHAWFFNVSGMTSAHTYVLLMSLYGGASAGVYLYNAKMTAAAGSASLNFATLGNGATLTSITET